MAQVVKIGNIPVKRKTRTSQRVKAAQYGRGVPRAGHAPQQSRLLRERVRVVVALVTERTTIDLFEGALGELSVAVGAAEVLRMEFPSDGRHAAAGDRRSALVTQRAASLVVVCLAERLTAVVEERAATERTAAHLTHEALRMPMGTECSDEVTGDRILTAIAFRRKESEEVTATVRVTVLLMESIIAELSSTLGACEAL